MESVLNVFAVEALEKLLDEFCGTVFMQTSIITNALTLANGAETDIAESLSGKFFSIDAATKRALRKTTGTDQEYIKNTKVSTAFQTKVYTAHLMETTKTARTTPWWKQFCTMVLVVFLLSGIIQTFIGRVYVVPSGSMEPTLHGCTGCTNDKILVNKIAPVFKDPKQGQIVVFEGTESWNLGYVEPRSQNKLIASLQDIGTFFGVVVPRENTLVKRVVAVGGQTIKCLPGDPGIMVDGKEISDEYTLMPHRGKSVPSGFENCGGKFFGPITVPENHVFVMGDNRTNSADSRYHIDDKHFGAIPVSNIIGYPQLIVYPFDRIQGLRTEPM